MLKVRYLSGVVALLVLTLLALVPAALAGPNAVDPRAQAFMDAVGSGNFTASDSMLSQDVAKGLKAQGTEGMGGLLAALTGQVGPLKSIGKGYAIDAPKGSRISVWPCAFNVMTLDLHVVTSDKGEVIGVFVKPHAEVRPEVVETVGYTENMVRLGDPKQPVPAAVVVPKGVVGFPVVMMLTGSGANDMDETVGPNKPFKDLAMGLASKGIASIRFDKRTRVYGAAPDPNTDMVDWEYMLDAKAAIALAREIPGAGRVIVLGHSEGGILAPAVARDNPGVAGIACLAGPASNILALVPGQLRHLASLGKFTLKDVEPAIAEIEAYLAGKPQGPTVMGAPKAYWDQVTAKGNPAEVAKALQLPVFLQFGTRDYQVPATEADVWKAIAGDGKQFTLKVYGGMNHLLMMGSGVPTSDEYMVAGHVAPELIEDLSAWINGLR